MSNEEKTEEDAPTANSMAAFYDKLTDLGEALSILYISRNSSGRNKFREKWPEVSEYLFGSTLISYDIEGVKDRELRSKLEDEADDRRIDLKQTINEIVEKSVNAGSLQFDYVGSVIDKYGVDMSLFLYAENIIERVRPGLLATRKDETTKNVIEQKEKEHLNNDSAINSETSEISENLQIDKNNNLSETTTSTNEINKDDNRQIPTSDEKLSSEEKSLLSNNVEISEEVKPIETSAPLETTPQPAADHSKENNQSSPAATTEEIKPVEAPPTSTDIKPIETTVPQNEGKIATQEIPTSESEMNSSVPDVLKPPAEESAPNNETSHTTTKIEELTVQQAAKAEKGVYMTMFNALAKPA